MGHLAVVRRCRCGFLRRRRRRFAATIIWRPSPQSGPGGSSERRRRNRPIGDEMRLRRAPFAQRLSGRIGVFVLAVSGSLLLLLSAQAQAVITEPIPADVAPGPPAISA